MEFHIFEFMLMTVVLFGWCSYQLGKAMANTWQSISLMIFYVFLLTAFDRFLLFALFEQELLSISMFLVDLIVYTVKISETRIKSLLISDFPLIAFSKGLKIICSFFTPTMTLDLPSSKDSTA